MNYHCGFAKRWSCPLRKQSWSPTDREHIYTSCDSYSFALAPVGHKMILIKLNSKVKFGNMNLCRLQIIASHERETNHYFRRVQV